MMRTASIAALALVAPVVVAQKATRPDGACPGGYSPNSSGECVADACDVNHIKTPRHGTMGNCATREFEFLHTRPDPIDDTEVTIASLEGTLATIGIPFADWGSDQTFRFTDGAVFWSTPEDGPTGSATVAQITVPTGSEFVATLNFQGKTVDAVGCPDSASDNDPADGCLEDNSWQEFQVHFSNSPEDNNMYRTYRWVTPQVLVITRDSIPGYTTYRLVVQLQPEARNVYAVFGTSGHPAILPAAFQEADPFGADIGGTHSSFWPLSPTSQYDSFVTLGEIDMEHPDIVDNVRMLASGTRCELTCDAGYVLSGEQPSCDAGAVTASVQCRNADGSVDPEVDVTGGSDLYAPDAAPANRPPATVGAPAPPTRPVRQPHPTGPPTPVVYSAAPTTEEDVSALPSAVRSEEEHAEGHTGTERSMMLIALAGCAIVIVLGALKLMCSSQPQISPSDAAAAAKMSGNVTPGPMPADFGKVETTDNNLFGGMVFETAL